jgi:NTP pyrophosphatase (non-canonical NTP hydrolase)
LGCLTEEIREFENAVQSNDLNKLKEELTDILIVALHGLASIESKNMDWPKEKRI